MAGLKESMADVMSVEGATAVAIVDANTGMVLGSAGSGIDFGLAAAGNAVVVRAETKTIEALTLNDGIEDILVSLGRQYHILRPIASKPGLFFCVVLDRERANLAMARRKVLDVETGLVL